MLLINFNFSNTRKYSQKQIDIKTFYQFEMNIVKKPYS